MNINYKQSQFELFPGSPGSSVETVKPRYLFANLTLSLENIVVAGILIMMFSIFSFSLGVERGKRVAVNKIVNEPMSTTNPPKMIASPNPVQNKSLPAVANVSIHPNEIGSADQTTITPNKPPAIEPVKTNSALEDLKNKTYTIQVASFKREDYAKQEAQILKKKGHDILVLGKGQHFIVCVGKFISENEAKIFSGRLKKQYRDCLVRRL